MKYLGIDWATQEHVVALLDEAGEEIAVWRVAHTWTALSALLDQLHEEGGPTGVLIGIEPGSPRVREVLIGAGYTLYEINPKSASRFRDRSSPAGAKDDRRDALVLAGAVRTDRGWMRPARAPGAVTEELRMRCRDRQVLVDTRRRLVQQLHGTLSEYYPAILALEMALTRPLVRALLMAYPSPRAAKRARRPRLAKLLRAHRIRKIDVDGLRALLAEESFPLSPGLESAYVDRTAWLLDLLAQSEVSLAAAQEKIAALFEQHPDCEILMSVPGVGVTLAPYIAAEIATSVGAAPAARALQATAGTSPRTRRSGRALGHVSMRRACHRGLQAALFNVARCSRAKSSWTRAYYAHSRARGVRHAAALRALSNKLAKIIATLLCRREMYDETRHVEDLRRHGVPWAPQAQTREEVAA